MFTKLLLEPIYVVIVAFLALIFVLFIMGLVTFISAYRKFVACQKINKEETPAIKNDYKVKVNFEYQSETKDELIADDVMESN